MNRTQERHERERHLVAGEVTQEVGLKAKGGRRQGDSAARRLPVVALFGRSGLVRDLVSHLLRSAGAAVRQDAVGDGGEPAVAVLVDPEQGDWDAAAQAHLPVVLVVPARLEDAALLDSVLRGADAVVEADSPPELVLEAIRMVGQGSCLFGPQQVKVVASAARAACHRVTAPIRLTDRERDILASIERGESVKQTAISLGVTSKTVENLQGRLFRKLGVRNRAEAVSRSHLLGLVADG